MGLCVPVYCDEFRFPLRLHVHQTLQNKPQFTSIIPPLVLKSSLYFFIFGLLCDRLAEGKSLLVVFMNCFYWYLLHFNLSCLQQKVIYIISALNKYRKCHILNTVHTTKQCKRCRKHFPFVVICLCVIDEEPMPNVMLFDRNI